MSLKQIACSWFLLLAATLPLGQAHAAGTLALEPHEAHQARARGAVLDSTKPTTMYSYAKRGPLRIIIGSSALHIWDTRHLPSSVRAVHEAKLRSARGTPTFCAIDPARPSAEPVFLHPMGVETVFGRAQHHGFSIAHDQRVSEGGHVALAKAAGNDILVQHVSTTEHVITQAIPLGTFLRQGTQKVDLPTRQGAELMISVVTKAGRKTLGVRRLRDLPPRFLAAAGINPRVSNYMLVDPAVVAAAEAMDPNELEEIEHGFKSLPDWGKPVSLANYPDRFPDLPIGANTTLRIAGQDLEITDASESPRHRFSNLMQDDIPGTLVIKNWIDAGL